MTSSCNTKMAAEEHLKSLCLRNQCSDRRYFNAYWTISITTYHFDQVIRIRIDDVIMQYQDGRQGTFTMLISQEPTFRLTSFQRLPYCTIPITTYHLDHVMRIRDLSKTPDTSARPQETSVSPQESSVRHLETSRDLSRSSKDLS